MRGPEKTLWAWLRTLLTHKNPQRNSHGVRRKPARTPLPVIFYCLRADAAPRHFTLLADKNAASRQGMRSRLRPAAASAVAGALTSQPPRKQAYQHFGTMQYCRWSTRVVRLCHRGYSSTATNRSWRTSDAVPNLTFLMSSRKLVDLLIDYLRRN